jgi:hypothetical protein
MADETAYEWVDLRQAAAECRAALERSGQSLVITDDRAPGAPER